MQDVRLQPLLVYGDWVVDEYWFLVRHQSDISSHTGFVHYRVSTEPGEGIVALCGAGQVARVLYFLRSGDPLPRPDIWGLGRWSPGDTDILAHLVHGDDPTLPQRCQAAEMSYRLERLTCGVPPASSGVHLRTFPDGRHTTRVVRLYHQEGTHLEQISRIDWESKPVLPRAPLDRPASDPDLAADLPESVGVIVVEDYVKGTVTPELVTKLCQKYPSARWHVRTKDKTRGWLAAVRDRLDLLIIGPEISALTKPWRSWLSDDRLTSQALALLQDEPKPNEPELKARHLVVLTDEREVIARLNGEQHCVTGRSNVERNPLVDIGWASAFFSALSWQVRRQPVLSDPEDAMKSAITQADRYGSIRPPQSTGVRSGSARPATVVVKPWPDEVEIGKQARSGHGLIAHENRLFLDVWRGSTNLPGYVICVEEKQAVVDRIGRLIRRFSRHPNSSTSLSIFLQADPGSGKTFLAQTLARAFDCSYVHFDITQMMHREDLLHIFDSVGAKQAEGARQRGPERPVLVFVDEINAPLDQDYVFGAFLAPVESGFYVRHGQDVMLRPCIWLFAGTRMEVGEISARSKFNDFISRMTRYEQIDFPSLKRKYESNTDPLYAQARLEQIYVGASMINKAFPDVRRVTQDVLYGFWKLDPNKSPARTLRRLATGFSNVQHGLITTANWDGQYNEIAEGFLYEPHQDAWLPRGEGDQLVELRFRAAES